MTERLLKLVAIYAEGSGRKDDPYKIILVDGNEDEHEAATPDALWQAIWAIYGDASLPPATIDIVHSEPEAVVRMASGGEDQELYDTIAEAAESFVDSRIGLGVGRIAGKLIRNGAGRDVHRFLRKVSR